MSVGTVPRFGHEFCRFCGARTLVQPRHPDTHLVCSGCKREIYVNSKPCAETVIIQDGHVLLVRRNIDPFRGYWDIPGGFLEEAELPDVGAIREAREETNLEVDLLGMIGMSLDTYPGEEKLIVLTISYLAEPLGNPKAGHEAEEICYFAEQDIPERLAFGHARETIQKAFVLSQQLSSRQ